MNRRIPASCERRARSRDGHAERRRARPRGVSDSDQSDTHETGKGVRRSSLSCVLLSVLHFVGVLVRWALVLALFVGICWVIAKIGLGAAEAKIAGYEAKKRRARILGRRESIPERVRQEVWRRDQGRCVYCGSRERLEFDHIIPFSRGGSSTVRNLQLLCERCNRRKGATI
jgi:hypothetical protein